MAQSQPHTVQSLFFNINTPMKLRGILEDIQYKWQDINRRTVVGIGKGKFALTVAGLLVLVLVIILPILITQHQKAGLQKSSDMSLPIMPGQEDDAAGPNTGFLRLNDMKKLEAGCRPYVVVGFNAFDLVEVAMVTPEAFRTQGGRSGEELVYDVLGQSSSMGINTIRTWAFSSNSELPFQISPGQYNERGLIALDFILYTARQLGLRVILCLIDNWHYYNSVDQYVDWSQSSPKRIYNRSVASDLGDPSLNRLQGHPLGILYGQSSDGNNSNSSREGMDDHIDLDQYERQRHSLFWSDPGCRKIFKAHAVAITQRRNTFTGRLYCDDPTIMAWELVNEPRCEFDPNCHELLQSWIVEMSAYVKWLAPKQLLTIGSEGFFGPSTPELQSTDSSLYTTTIESNEAGTRKLKFEAQNPLKYKIITNNSGIGPLDPLDPAQLEQFMLEQSGLLELRPPLPAAASGDNFYHAIPYQILSWAPRIVVFPAFVDKARCDHIIALASKMLHPSGLAYAPGQKAEEEQQTRTSQGTFLMSLQDPDGVLGWVEERIAAVTLIPRENGEAFNVLRYETNQHYDSHMDTFDPKVFGPQPSQRVATVLVYLSDVEEGGETIFKKEGYDGDKRVVTDWRNCDDGSFKYKPRRGDAVLFWSVNNEGDIDPRALHGGCPVKKGIKWTMTKWLRNKGSRPYWS